MNLFQDIDPGRMRREVMADGSIALSMYVAPHYRTPKHFHEHFVEHFEVLVGKEVEFGRGKQVVEVPVGGRVSVPERMVHYFHNRSPEPAIVRVSVSAEHHAFETAFLIYHGLVRDGMVNKKMHPKNFGDLALFLKLTNSRMPGLGKYLAEPFFLRAAAKAVASGRLKELVDLYASNVHM
jgi:quercetin dioxygenase-like cupin family protein